MLGLGLYTSVNNYVHLYFIGNLLRFFERNSCMNMVEEKVLSATQGAPFNELKRRQ